MTQFVQRTNVARRRVLKISRDFVMLFGAVAFLCFVACSSLTQADDAAFQLTSEGGARVYLDGKFFAEYRPDFRGTPIVWPICAPNQSLATRAWPMIDALKPGDFEDREMREIYQNAIISERGGVKDHPHHRSMWFNHGNVNRGDFWGGTPSVIVQTKLVSVEKVGKNVVLKTENVWKNDKENRDDCSDKRALVFGKLDCDKDVRFIDFAIEITALHDNVVFGDTKEGSFGLRVPSPTAATSKKLSPQWGGAILNSLGDKDADAWGKQAKWVDYVGPAERFLSGDELENVWKNGDEDDRNFPLTTIGIAVLDGPSSLGALPRRHVRDYGLFADNPFGEKDFDPKSKKDGSVKLNANETMTFHFRVLFHNGDLSPEDLNRIAKDYDASFNENSNPNDK